MTLERDAAFLAGFIVGTYDLRGDAPPAYIQPFLDRVLKTTVVPRVEEIIQSLTPPKPDFGSGANEKSQKITRMVNAMQEEAEIALPDLTRRMLEKANERREMPTVVMAVPEQQLSTDDEGEDRKELVRRLAGMGWTDAGIGKKLGISLGGVFAIRKRHGIPSGREQKASAREQANASAAE